MASKQGTPGPSSSTTQAKVNHYSTALTDALLRGNWADGNPAKDVKGYDLSWGELGRKWAKHTQGNASIIYHLRDISLLYLSAHSHDPQTSASGYITISKSNPSASTSIQPPATPTAPSTSTSTNQHPADIGSSNSSAEAEAGPGSSGTSGSSFIHVPHPNQRSPTTIARSVSRPVGTTGRESIGASTLRQTEKAAYLSARDLDGDDSYEDKSWEEGGDWWNGVRDDQVEEVKEGIRVLENELQVAKGSSAQVESIRLLLGYHHHAIGEHEIALRIYNEINWKSDPKAGIIPGEAAILDKLRGKCLQAVSTELLNPGSSSSLNLYLEVLTLSLQLLPFPTPPYLSPAQIPKIPFEGNREIFRWISLALTRASIISSRQPNNTYQSLRISRTYHALSAQWPSSFKPIQRQRMLILYLTALSLSYPKSHVSCDKPYLLDKGESNLSARNIWRKESLKAIKDGQFLLSQSTRFPKAGQVNKPVIDYTNLCMSLTERSSSLIRDVIEILWFSMNLTFQSQSILRHLSKLLEKKGSYIDAKRVFELYVQLVLKSRQTSQPEGSLHLKNNGLEGEENQTKEEKHKEDDEAGKGGLHKDDDTALLEGDLTDHVKDSGIEGDSDEEFIEALLVGSRIFTKGLNEMEEGWKYAVLARDVVDKAGKGRVSSKLRAKVEECLGIVRMSMASSDIDPIQRPTYQAQAINHLKSSTSLDPSNGQAFYHLSYSQAEARSISEATDSIRRSIEIESGNVQAWHLLALLLTAKRDWEGARKACEAGIAVWENEEETDHLEEDDVDLDDLISPTSPANSRQPAIESKDYASPARKLSTVDSSENQSPALLSSAGRVVIVDQLSAPIPRISRTKRLENVIRLRMTLTIIIEKTQGPEMAMIRQQELFAFFSARSGNNRLKFGYESSGMKGFDSVPSVGGLGGSYISVQGSVPDSINALSQQPPAAPGNGGLSAPAPVITHSAASSPGNTTPEGQTDDEGMEVLDEKADGEKEKRKSMTSKSKSLAKHLHVPHVKSMSKGRPSSIRRVQVGSANEPAGTPQRSRIASQSSVALSLAPTAIHSHFHGQTNTSFSGRNPAPPPLDTSSHGRTPAESRLLSSLWLMSAATFRRWDKPEQCLVAINEAENLDPENGDVWVQLGLYHSTINPPHHPSKSSSDNNSLNGDGVNTINLGSTISMVGHGGWVFDYEAALSSFTKSILLRPLHPSAIVQLSKLYLKTNQVDLAHTFLNQLTQDMGWDVPEAWFLLSQVCKEQGRFKREKECLIYALGLEETRPARRWREAVDRWL